MVTEDIDLDVTDGIATITLDRPETMNALSAAINRGIAEALERIDDREDTRCVVITGRGDAFCAGGDVAAMADRDDAASRGHERAAEITDGASSVALGLHEFDLPTIARVDGYCFGAGLGVALANDVVLASDEALFSLAFRNVGLTLDYGTSYFVTEALGPYKAKEIALTGERFSGERAAEMGLVNHAYPAEEFDERADEFVRHVADGPTVALEYSLRNIDRAPRRTLEEAIEAEAESQTLAGGTRDHEEGVAAFQEGRDPDFEGR
jgi:2-(1,2-epoxy-1,2-dihydrophenyl)acetyl-CoA isomerase